MVTILKVLQKAAIVGLSVLGLGVVSSFTGVSTASALTVDFDGSHPTGGNVTYDENGFRFTYFTSGTGGGNCNSGDCATLFVNDYTVMSVIAGGSFSLDGFWYQDQGNPNTITIYGFNYVVANPSDLTTGRVWEYGLPGAPGGTVYSCATGTTCAAVQSVLFVGAPNGNGNVDDVNATVIPLPAGVWLLLSALGGLGLAGWRKSRAAMA